jgi:hypothetical protein
LQYSTQIVLPAGYESGGGISNNTNFALNWLGASYQVVPGTLALNAGVSAAFGYNSTTTRQSPFGYGVETEKETYYSYSGAAGDITRDEKETWDVDGDDTLTTRYSWNNLTPTFSAGLTINFNQDIALDAAFDTGINISLSSVRLLLTLKK